MAHSVQAQLNNGSLSIETGKVARQADGAVVVRCGGTTVLSTVVAAKSPMESRDRDFLPLTVEYRERAYAGGRIPGGFFKREGRPDEKETLTCRLIDRPLRPLFPKGFRNELQIINLVISADDENDPDVLAMVGSSVAVALSGIPFSGPIEAILMVESGGREISEEQMLEALAFGHEQCRQLARIQKELIAKAGEPRWPFEAQAGADPALEARIKELATAKVVQALSIHEKQARAQ